MNVMTFRRTLVLAAVLVFASAAAANAQSAWPNAQPQPQSAWPSQPQPQPQPQAQPQQAPWPSSASAAPPQPQQAPWPANGPQAAPPMGGGGGFGGPPMGGGGGFGGSPMGGPPPECTAQFTALRAEVEKRGMAARAGGEKRVAREEMCKLVTSYGEAETKWIKFTESNMTKCGIPKELVAQLKAVHAKTTDGQKKLCAAGPAVAATPTLSDALGTATLPVRETEKKRKPGGTMDTLTGNALGQ
jgi:hypothetical protein